MPTLRNSAAKTRDAQLGANEVKAPGQSLAQQELARRVLARRRLIHFILRFTPNYNAGWVHKLICAKLEKFSYDVANRGSPRLMFFMPPRAGKSKIASEMFPAWHLGHHPEHEIIASSYAVSLPMSFSRKIKDLLRTTEYQALFPDTVLDPNAQATEGWHTLAGGGYIPSGVGTGISGKGAHVFVIDDPVKDAQEADSEITREAVWAWWDSVAETRLAPGAGVLEIQTRWHDEDLAGKMLSQEKELSVEIDELIDIQQERLEDPQLTPRQQAHIQAKLRQFELERKNEITHWDVVSFPALATTDEYLSPEANLVESDDDLSKTHTGYRLLRKKNEALHPYRYDEFFFKRKRRTSMPRVWSALYQQNPVPDEGAYFKKDMFRYNGLTPNDWAGWDIYQAWDLAIGKKSSNDWTVGLTGALDYDGNLHLLNCVRVRTTALSQLILDTAIPYQHQLQGVGIEQGQIQMSIMPELRKLVDRYKDEGRLKHYPQFRRNLEASDR